jgi:hypothetical protein
MSKIAKPNYAVALQPCPSGRIIAEKRVVKDFPNCLLQTSFMLRPLYVHLQALRGLTFQNSNYHIKRSSPF